jgi:hypothetical protein
LGCPPSPTIPAFPDIPPVPAGELGEPLLQATKNSANSVVGRLSFVKEWKRIRDSVPRAMESMGQNLARTSSEGSAATSTTTEWPHRAAHFRPCPLCRYSMPAVNQ